MDLVPFLKDCQKLTAITSCYTAVHQPSQTHQGHVEQKMGNLACKQAFLLGQGVRAVKLDLGRDSGHLASLFSSRSIHEFGFLVNVQFQKISILPPQEGLEFPGGWGFWKIKKYKEMYEALKYYNFQRGGEVWIFSGTTQCLPAQSYVSTFFNQFTHPRIILKYILCCKQSHGK